jgi:hypothetical protein
MQLGYTSTWKIIKEKGNMLENIWVDVKRKRNRRLIIEKVYEKLPSQMENINNLLDTNPE